MMRKATKQSPSANADEKAYMRWLKEREICSACGIDGPVIVHHCKGSSFKHNKQLIGHMFCLGLCQRCDDLVTNGSIKRLEESAGQSQSQMWDRDQSYYDGVIPRDLYDAIWDYGVGR